MKKLKLVKKIIILVMIGVCLMQTPITIYASENSYFIMNQDEYTKEENTKLSEKEENKDRTDVESEKQEIERDTVESNNVEVYTDTLKNTESIENIKIETNIRMPVVILESIIVVVIIVIAIGVVLWIVGEAYGKKEES